MCSFTNLTFQLLNSNFVDFCVFMLYNEDNKVKSFGIKGFKKAFVMGNRTLFLSVFTKTPASLSK